MCKQLDIARVLSCSVEASLAYYNVLSHSCCLFRQLGVPLGCSNALLELSISALLVESDALGYLDALPEVSQAENSQQNQCLRKDPVLKDAEHLQLTLNTGEAEEDNCLSS